MDTGFEVHEFWDGEINVVAADAGGTLTNVNEAAFILVDQRTKEDATHEAEDGGVRTDAERESDDDGESEAFSAQERAKGKSQILSEQGQCLHRSLLDEDMDSDIDRPVEEFRLSP